MKAVLIALAAGLALGSGGAWWAQDLRSDAELARLRQGHAEVLGSIAEKTQQASEAVRAYEWAVTATLAAVDAKHTEELNNEKLQTQKLRDCVRTGTCGVRIVTRYSDQPGGAGRADACSSGMGDAAVTLDAGVSERVLDLRDAIAGDAAALSYLQGYARQCQAASAVMASQHHD